MPAGGYSGVRGPGGITGFPTETFEKTHETIDFLADNRELWTFGGLSNVRPAVHEGVARSLDYDEPSSQGTIELSRPRPSSQSLAFTAGVLGPAWPHAGIASPGYTGYNSFAKPATYRSG